MEMKPGINKKPNNISPVYFLKKVPSFLKRILGYIRVFFKNVWDFMCQNKTFARFAYVTFPASRKKVGKYIKGHYRRVIIIAVIGIAALTTLLFVMIKNTENSDLPIEKGKEAEFATVIPTYPSFDQTGKIRVLIELNWEDGALNLHDGHAEARIKAKVYPVTIKDQTITWKSSNESVAVIDADGKITASKPGETEITAYLESENKSAHALLSVKQPVSGIFMPTSTITLYAGGESRLVGVNIFPEDATNKNLRWKSKNTKVARVDNSGRVTPVSVGMTEIVVTSEDGGFEGKCFVNVVNKTVEVESVSIKNSEDMKLAVGDSITAVAKISPSNAKNKTLEWSSDNPKVASVSQTGRIRGVSEGMANITAKTQNGKKAVFPIEVIAADTNDLPDDQNGGNESEAEGGIKYVTYDATFVRAVKMQMLQNPAPKIWHNGRFDYASEMETAQYMNPNNYYTDAYKYQFLDLSETNNVSAERLNEYLADKGALKGKGDVFIEAARRYNVSEVYLVAHACLESGNGTSRLANGVDVNGTTVYNIFGINAYDSNPVESGSSRAYEQGWTSVDKAIMGGAQWISEKYINNAEGRQNTLYKMRWNPDMPGEHQYATDISWAVKQSVSIEKIFSSFDDMTLSFEVPVYDGQIPPDVTLD